MASKNLTFGKMKLTEVVPVESIDSMIARTCEQFKPVVLSRVEVSEFVAIFPLKRSIAECSFSDEILTFAQGNQGTVAGANCGQFSNNTGLGGNSVINCPMLLAGVQFNIETGPELWSVIGELTPQTTGATPAVAGPLGQGDQNVPAIFDEGTYPLIAKKLFLMAYSFSLILECRTILIDHPMSIIGLCENEEVEGLGSATRAVADTIRNTNRVANANGLPGAFIPVNATDLGTGEAPNYPVSVERQLASLSEKGYMGGRLLIGPPLWVNRNTAFSARFYVDGPEREIFRQKLLDAVTEEPAGVFYADGLTEPLTDFDTLVNVSGGTAAIVPNLDGEGTDVTFRQGTNLPASVVRVTTVSPGVFTAFALQQIQSAIPVPLPGSYPTIQADTVITPAQLAAAGLIFQPAPQAIGQARTYIRKSGYMRISVYFFGVEVTYLQSQQYVAQYGELMSEGQWQHCTGTLGSLSSDRGGISSSLGSIADTVRAVEEKRKNPAALLGELARLLPSAPPLTGGGPDGPRCKRLRRPSSVLPAPSPQREGAGGSFLRRLSARRASLRRLLASARVRFVSRLRTWPRPRAKERPPWTTSPILQRSLFSTPLAVRGWRARFSPETTSRWSTRFRSRSRTSTPRPRARSRFSTRRWSPVTWSSATWPIRSSGRSTTPARSFAGKSRSKTRRSPASASNSSSTTAPPSW